MTMNALRAIKKVRGLKKGINPFNALSAAKGMTGMTVAKAAASMLIKKKKPKGTAQLAGGLKKAAKKKAGLPVTPSPRSSECRSARDCEISRTFLLPHLLTERNHLQVRQRQNQNVADASGIAKPLTNFSGSLL